MQRWEIMPPIIKNQNFPCLIQSPWQKYPGSTSWSLIIGNMQPTFKGPKSTPKKMRWQDKCTWCTTGPSEPSPQHSCHKQTPPCLVQILSCCMPPVLGWPLQGQAPCAFVSMISASLVISRCRLGLCLSNHHATMTAFTFAYEQKLEWLLRTTYGFYGPYNARQWGG